MVLNVLRALFVLLMAAVGWLFLRQLQEVAGFGARTGPLALPDYTWLSVAASLTVGVFIVCVDILAPRRKLTIFSGTFLGLLVGLIIAYAMSFVVMLVVDQYFQITDKETRLTFVRFLNTAVGVISCYLSISFILQTKDDFRFIIPYVEFSKQTKGARPFVLDSSVLIDGRIEDVAKTGILESQLIAPHFIEAELQRLADSADKMIRARGRRGLDVLGNLMHSGRPEVVRYDSSGREDKTLIDEDQKLIALARELNARILTNDYNLNKVAQLRGVDVINLNELANAMKPEVMPGEKMTVRLIKPGEAPGQGVGYLDDGTMVVVEGGRSHVNEEVEFTVTNTRQTVQGRMIFGRLGGDGTLPPPSRKSHPPRSAATVPPRADVPPQSQPNP
jgi:uncharacterized protein YacL